MLTYTKEHKVCKVGEVLQIEKFSFLFVVSECPQAVVMECQKTASYLHLARVVALGVVRSPAYFKNSGSIPCGKKQLGRMCHVPIQVHNQVVAYLTVTPDFGRIKV